MDEKGRGIGESTRLLPGFESRGRRDVWFKFAATFLPWSEEFYFGHSGFQFSEKPHYPSNSNFTGVVALDPHLLIICFRAGHWREYSPSNVRPGFKSRRRRHMSVEFVVGSLLCCLGLFFGYFTNVFAPVKFNSPSHYYLSDIVTSGLLWLVSFTLLRILIILLARNVETYKGVELHLK